MSEASWGSWNISETPFPAANQPMEQLRFLLLYAILAPSTHNTQPWLFKIRGDALERYADRAKPSVSCEVTGKLCCVGWMKHSIQATADDVRGEKFMLSV
jgi:nitroreductase